MKPLYNAVDIKDRGKNSWESFPSSLLATIVLWQRDTIITHPVIAISACSAFNEPVVREVHAHVKHCIDVNGLALFSIRVIDSFVTIPESRYDVLICNHIPEIDGIFDDIDGHTAGAFDALGYLCFDILSRVPLVLFERLPQRLATLLGAQASRWE